MIQEFEIFSQRICMLPERVLYLPKDQTILVADLHFGKVNHFRKSGIAVPVSANEKNAALLIDVIQKTKPKRVIFLGDLFHSHYNQEWETVGQIVQHFVEVSFELVIGNHDILSKQQYVRHTIKVHEGSLTLGQWLLTHEPMTFEKIPEGFYNLAGHIHPGVRLQGAAKQALLLPCFYFGKKQGLLPAFGSFTGLARIYPKVYERIFVLADGKVMGV